MMITDRRAGFTLIEMLLSVALIGALAGISLPVYVSFQSRNELSVATTAVTEALRRAQTYARSGSEDSQWGVAHASGTLILFKGSTYASRDATFDEEITLPQSVTTAGLTEIVFSKVTGLPNTAGTIIVSGATGDARTVTVNVKGAVGY